MRIWVGLELLGCKRNSAARGVRNGCTYTVTALEGESVQLTDGQHEITLSAAQVGAQLRYSWARTYYGVQGWTFRDKRVQLMDTRHVHFTRRHAYVAVSRVTDPDLCSVPTPQQEGELYKQALATTAQLVQCVAEAKQEHLLRRIDHME